MTNRMQKVLRSISETMLRHPDVKTWILNYGDAVHVTQWDGWEQINYSFYGWQEDAIINTQLDNLEQMCWLILNKRPRPETDARPETDDENINYSTERHN